MYSRRQEERRGDIKQKLGERKLMQLELFEVGTLSDK